MRTPSPLRAVLAVALAAAGCYSSPDPQATRAVDRLDELTPAVSIRDNELSPDSIDLDLMRRSSPAPNTGEYRIGPSDRVRVTVVGHNDLSGDYVVGPDGRVGVPLIGTMDLQGLTRAAAANAIREGVSPYLADQPFVTVDVVEYRNNRVYVLGRVELPGVVELTGSGTLLQALSEAGGLPVREFRASLTRAAIIRGSEEILWVDLVSLLQKGEVALNVPLRNGDVVFIPDSEDATVFVMGEVASPGAVPVKARIFLSQALAKAGGPTRDADLEQVYLLRPSRDGSPIEPILIDFEHLLETGDFSENIELQSNDIVYVARSGLGDVGYVLERLSPGLNIIWTAAAVK